MARPDRARRVDSRQADNHAELGRRLLHAGRVIVESGDNRHASALAILSVHAAIAFSDAAAVHAGGRKSTSDDHEASVRLLRSILGNRLPAKIETTFTRLLAEKDRFEYQGYLATMRDASSMFARAEQLGTWVEELLTSIRRAEG